MTTVPDLASFVSPKDDLSCWARHEVQFFSSHSALLRSNLSILGRLQRSGSQRDEGDRQHDARNCAQNEVEDVPADSSDWKDHQAARAGR